MTANEAEAGYLAGSLALIIMALSGYAVGFARGYKRGEVDGYADCIEECAPGGIITTAVEVGLVTVNGVVVAQDAVYVGLLVSDQGNPDRTTSDTLRVGDRLLITREVQWPTVRS